MLQLMRKRKREREHLLRHSKVSGEGIDPLVFCGGVYIRFGELYKFFQFFGSFVTVEACSIIVFHFGLYMMGSMACCKDEE